MNWLRKDHRVRPDVLTVLRRDARGKCGFLVEGAPAASRYAITGRDNANKSQRTPKQQADRDSPGTAYLAKSVDQTQNRSLRSCLTLKASRHHATIACYHNCIASQTRRVAELREGLVEEGRRRRQLYDERKWAAQSELRRVLAEREAVREKEGMLRLLLQVCILGASPCSCLFSPECNQSPVFFVLDSFFGGPSYRNIPCECPPQSECPPPPKYGWGTPKKLEKPRGAQIIFIF